MVSIRSHPPDFTLGPGVVTGEGGRMEEERRDGQGLRRSRCACVKNIDCLLFGQEKEEDVGNRPLKVHIRSRTVTVEGPRGKLVKDLSHIAVTFGRPEKNVISIELHHGVRKGIATLRTVRTIINNLIIGVTKGFKYKMRYVYAHFPINVNIEKNGETGQCEIEIRNFLGEKYVRRVIAQPGVEIITSPNVKDELQLSGNSLEGVSQSAADIQQICRVRNKDIRKFLDGLYVSERGNIVEE
ncbi:60S ribosomal protein L9B [Aspergillus melleus]|uniref:60S ribosomal protein L9B n=1 Tax=Aspergillus melleus TaxID=138277 RepID=A0ACC3BIC0_9EURO|nr:60S ribosomal protein L9B [Aspergillus melleus]